MEQYMFVREAILIKLYTRWLNRHGYTPMSADELACEIDNKEHQAWLARFINVWNHYSSGRNKF